MRIYLKFPSFPSCFYLIFPKYFRKPSFSYSLLVIGISTHVSISAASPEPEPRVPGTNFSGGGNCPENREPFPEFMNGFEWLASKYRVKWVLIDTVQAVITSSAHFTLLSTSDILIWIISGHATLNFPMSPTHKNGLNLPYFLSSWMFMTSWWPINSTHLASDAWRISITPSMNVYFCNVDHIMSRVKMEATGNLGGSLLVSIYSDISCHLIMPENERP